LRLSLRQPVARLGKAQGKTNLEAARKAIANIISDNVRRIIAETFEVRIAQGMEAGASLTQPILHPFYGKLIRKVRCFETYAEDAQPIGFTSRHGEHRKYLINAGYAYLELCTDGSREPRLVKTRDAMHEKGKPTPQNSMRIYKGDVVMDSKDSLLYKACFFKAAGVIGLLPIWEPRSFKEANEKADKGIKVGGTISFTPAAKRLKVVC